METTTMWIFLIIIATLCLVFIRTTIHASKISSEDTSKEEEKDTHKISEGVPGGQELNAGDVFGEPRWSRLLCVVLANGVQNLRTLAVLVPALIPIIIGFDSPRYRSIVVKAMAIFYLFDGASACYIAVVLWKTMKGSNASSEGWIAVSWPIPLLSCGTIYSMNSIIEFDAIEITLHTAWLAGILFCISIPITMLGGYLGAQADPIQFPVLKSKSTRLDTSNDNYRSWVLILVAGYLSSMITASEIGFVLISTWHMTSLFNSGSLLITLILLIVSVCRAWLLLIRVVLSSGESHWYWWKPFFLFGGPLALHSFLRTMTWPALSLNATSWLTSFLLNMVESLILGIFVLITGGTLGSLFVFGVDPQVKYRNKQCADMITVV